MVNYGNTELSIDQKQGYFSCISSLSKRKNVNVSSIY